MAKGTKRKAATAPKNANTRRSKQAAVNATAVTPGSSRDQSLATDRTTTDVPVDMPQLQQEYAHRKERRDLAAGHWSNQENKDETEAFTDTTTGKEGEERQRTIYLHSGSDMDGRITADISEFVFCYDGDNMELMDSNKTRISCPRKEGETATLLEYSMERNKGDPRFQEHKGILMERRKEGGQVENSVSSPQQLPPVINIAFQKQPEPGNSQIVVNGTSGGSLTGASTVNGSASITGASTGSSLQSRRMEGSSIQEETLSGYVNKAKKIYHRELFKEMKYLNSAVGWKVTRKVIQRELYTLVPMTDNPNRYRRVPMPEADMDLIMDALHAPLLHFIRNKRGNVKKGIRDKTVRELNLEKRRYRVAVFCY